MIGKLKDRYFILGILLTFIFISMLFQLITIQIHKGDYFYAQSQERKRRTIPLKGIRGKILDSNALPLAFDQKSYDVEFFKDPSENTKEDRKKYSQIIYETIKIIEKNGGETINTFPIQQNTLGSYQFTWNGLTGDDLVRREKRWKSDMLVKNEMSPKEIYEYLLSRYQIPEEWSDDEKQKVLSIWQEVQFSSFRAYLPVKISKNVNMSTVAEIETRNMDLAGMNIAESTVRVYPKSTLACHIIGYLGKMYFDADTMKNYEEMGYSRDDLIGREGVEATFEKYLTGNLKEHQGQRVVEVNNRGKITRELSIDPPTPGNNVMLTIDAKMQKKLEEALQANIKDIQNLPSDPAPLAKFGAAVVMDVNTGNVLAMASYPGYDPNTFVDGLDSDEMKSLFEDPRNPMINYALGASSKTPGGTPGSIFKMVTGLAGLMENKIAVNERIDDQGEYKKYVKSGHGPTCWVNPNFFRHSDQDIVKALKNSCNYYFFEVASRLGIDLLNKWSDLLGLTSKTGIELPNEYPGFVGNQDTLLNKTFIPTLVKQEIKKVIMRDTNINCSDDVLDKFLMVDRNNAGVEIRNILEKELEINDNRKKADLGIKIGGLLTEVNWDGNLTIRTGIGQGVTILSPIGVARYISALVNGGKAYEAHIVKKVISSDGTIIMEKQPKVITDLKLPKLYADKIKEGMKEVVSLEDGGTAGKYFENFKYKDAIGGKTGTAEVSKADSRKNNAWFVAFAPYEKPEIAVVVFIPNGRHGAYASPTAREIIEFYLDRKEKIADDNIPLTNSFIQ